MAFIIHNNFSTTEDLYFFNDQLKKNIDIFPKLVFFYTDNIDSVSCTWSRLERSSAPIINIVKELPFKIIWIGDTVLATIDKHAHLKKQRNLSTA